MSSCSPGSNASQPVIEARLLSSTSLDSNFYLLARAGLTGGGGGILFCFTADKDQIVRQQQSAKRDTRVSNIESRPVILTGVQHDEIDHQAQPHAIGQVP